MHQKMKHIYIGVDCHKKTHTAVVVNCWQEKLDEITFKNNPEGFEQLLVVVKKHVKKGIKPVFGLEDVDSLGRALAVFLLQEKKIVKKVNASLTYSERRNQSIVNKTDSYDALCIARITLNKLDELPDASPNDIYWTLAQLVGMRTSLVNTNITLKNKLHAQLLHHYPSYHDFFSNTDCQTALEMWENYPAPSKLKNVSFEDFTNFLRKHSHNGISTKRAEKILDLIQKDNYAETEYQESRNFIIKNIVSSIKQNNTDIEKLESEIQNVMTKIGYKLESFIGLELVTSAEIAAEIGDIQRFASSDKLAKYAGICPVNYSSGEKDRKLRNRQGNRNLYTHIYLLASRQLCQGRNKDNPINPIFLEYHNRKVSEGKTKKQALICVMRRIINILYGMMKNKSEYRHPELPKK
jgi:transposase